MNKLSLTEWMAERENTSEEWAESILKDSIKVGHHAGDCTKENYTCILCALETTLREYYEYVFEK